jgi:hypothetical protein
VNAAEIKRAVDEGLHVFWIDQSYEVIKGKRLDDYYIKSLATGHCIRLTHSDGITLNGKKSDFYIGQYS